jgi:Fe/S biogenesis protein NfuA
MSADVSDTAATDPLADGGPVMTITDAALAKVLEIRSGEDDADELGLRIEITGSAGPDYEYDLAFAPLDDAEATDRIDEFGDLSVIVPEATVVDLQGATLDLPGNPMQGGLVVRNPNRPDPLAGSDLELTGDLPQQVQQLLDQSINPSLASHGGFATLIGVEDTKVFLTMGGGCQGCAMSAATLREGIQRAILEAVPEITEVVDATDHEAGENPFYA